jgi:serine/threonine protein kinase
MRTVVCLYALCDEFDTILQVSIVLLFYNVTDADKTQRKVCKKIRCVTQKMVDFVIEEYNTSQQLELCDHCHRIEAASQQEGTWVYRLYSDYAEHGDLRGLINIYYQEANRDKQIPEQFIWMVFHALADAICTMNTGQCGETLDEEKAAKERQEVQEIEKEGPKTKTKTKKQKQGSKKARRRFKGEMVHLDVKPENVFLNTGKAPHLAYPKPLLADYDVVKMIAPQTDTMEGRKDWGTKGFQAPEIIVEAVHHHPVNAKTDVWSLGMVIWKMMHTTLGREKSNEICESSIKASFQFTEAIRLHQLTSQTTTRCIPTPCTNL